MPGYAARLQLPTSCQHYLLVCTAVIVTWKSPRKTLLAFVPAVAVVAAGFFGTNYLAHGTLSPAYAHRSDGAVAATLPREISDSLDRKELPNELRQRLAGINVELSDQALLLVDQKQQRWVLWDRIGQKRYALVANGDQVEVRAWNNWYDYPGSYWKTARQGVDKGEPSRMRYALHSLIGHRGLFSLTPIWLLAVVGGLMLVGRAENPWRLFAVMVLGLSFVCLAFYISRPEIDRNYGGVCCGFRWMFWFTPLWLLCMLPAVEWLLSSKAGRALAVVLLLVSVFSATYAATNPWSQPWLFEFGTSNGWWDYS